MASCAPGTKQARGAPDAKREREGKMVCLHHTKRPKESLQPARIHGDSAREFLHENVVHEVVVRHPGLAQGRRCADHGKLRLQARSKLATLRLRRGRERGMFGLHYTKVQRSRSKLL